MRLSTASLAIASLLSLASASHGHHGAPHASAARRHMHHHSRKSGGLTKRSQCKFPTDKGLVAVTPGAMNAGWAMSPDQPCEPGMYCPYACPPGMLMAQWDPKATKYAYPESMRGGLYCNDDGEIEIPFENKPLCYPGTGVYSVKNESGKSVAICQTVLPGNEAMLIPTVVQSSATLAVPDTSYWCKTAAHYYINPPGVSATDGCIWGTKDKPHGNWTPYVAGANTLDNGETFVKIGWNPIYIEPDVPFRTERPKYGIRVECEGTCGGLPCEIDPAKHDVNEVSQMKGSGAGGANFCVVSVSKGSKANLVIFNSNGGGGGNDKPKDEEEEKPKEEEEEEEKPEEEEEEEKPEEEEEEEEEKEEEEEEEKGIKGVQVKTSTSATSTKTSSREATSTSSQAPTKSARPSRIPLFVEETTSAYEPEKTEEPENDNRHNVLAQAGGNPISDDSGSLTADGSESDKPSAGLRIEASQLAALLVTGTMGVIALVL